MEMDKILIGESTAGIYCYKEKKTGKIVYIGKDSNIKAGRRHYDHHRDDFKSRQLVNKVLQESPGIYIYEEIAICSKFWLDALESKLIQDHQPMFNKEGNATNVSNNGKRKRGRPKKQV